MLLKLLRGIVNFLCGAVAILTGIYFFTSLAIFALIVIGRLPAHPGRIEYLEAPAPTFTQFGIFWIASLCILFACIYVRAKVGKKYDFKFLRPKNTSQTVAPDLREGRFAPPLSRINGDVTPRGTMDPAARRRDIGQLLAQLLPGHVLRDAHSLALSFEREEFYRRYALRRMWLIIPAALVFAGVSTACASAVVSLSFRLLEPPIARWVFILVVGLGVAIWLGGMILQLYVLFSWLEQRAMRQISPSDPDRHPPSAGAVISTRHRNPLSLLFLIGIFIFVPLVIVATIWPSLALVLLAAGLFAPILVTLLDR